MTPPKIRTIATSQQRTRFSLSMCLFSEVPLCKILACKEIFFIMCSNIITANLSLSWSLSLSLSLSLSFSFSLSLSLYLSLSLNQSISGSWLEKGLLKNGVSFHRSKLQNCRRWQGKLLGVFSPVICFWNTKLKFCTDG